MHFLSPQYGETEEQRIEHAKFVASLDLRKSADAAADSAAAAAANPVQAQVQAAPVQSEGAAASQ
jgi:hypothetical protein